MATDFASEHRTPGNRFRPGPGQSGTKAGLNAARGGPARPSRRAAPDAKRGGGLGLPAAPDPSEKPQDFRHLMVLAQHQNMKDLGRDAPVGIHAINNGDFRQIFEPGRVPFDWFLDT